MAQQHKLRAIINKIFRNGVTFEQEVLKISTKNAQNLMQLFKYVPFYDSEGLLRIGKILQKSDIVFQIKHILLLLHKHRITELYIQKKQSECRHFGPDFVFGSCTMIADYGQ